jgi:hypothetical protein
VRIYHIVDSPDLPHPWLVMELVRGRSLQDRLVDGPLPPVEAAHLGRGVLAALRAVHAAGICHRDVKPGNVLLRTDGSPVLTDFGIAALEDSSRVTMTGGLVGSPEYIAPERLNGEEGNPASDLWSLGLMLYVAVEGDNPLRRQTPAATLAAIVIAQIPPPRQAGSLTPALQALLVTDPARRPNPDHLDQLLAHAAGLAQPPGHGRPGGFTPPSGFGPPAAFPQPGGAAQPGGFTQPGGGAQPGGAAQPAGLGQPGAFTQPGGAARPPATPQPGGFAQPGAGAPPDGFGQYGAATHPGAGGFPPPGGFAQPGQAGGGTFPLGAATTGGGMFAPTGPPAPPSARPRLGVIAVGAVSVVSVVTALTVSAVVLLPGLLGGTSSTGNGRTTISSGPSATGRSTSGSTAGTTTDQATTLLTPVQVRKMIGLFEQASKSTKFAGMTVYEDYADVDVPVSGRRSAFDEYTYDKGADAAVRKGPSVGVTDDATVSLHVFDWDALPALLARAKRTLNVAKPTNRYIIIEPAWTFNGDKPTLLVYLTDDYGGGYLAANTKGQVIKTYPAK